MTAKSLPLVPSPKPQLKKPDTPKDVEQFFRDNDVDTLLTFDRDKTWLRCRTKGLNEHGDLIVFSAETTFPLNNTEEENRRKLRVAELVYDQWSLLNHSK